MAKVALFLGAGASKAFGYPTTLDFVHNLKKVLELMEKKLLDSILKSPNVSDIEHILQKLDPIVNLGSDDYFKTVFDKTKMHESLLGVETSINTFFTLCKTLRQTIINELYTQYEFEASKIKKILDCYDELHLILDRINGIRELHVFTSNYDSVFERYWNNTSRIIESTCGFRRDRRSGRQFWYPEELKNWKFDPKKNYGIRLYKLHGSLDWREMEDDRIERVPIEERVSSRSRTYKRNALIYPAQKHYATEEPFRRLQRYFEDILNQHDRCLVIGFSFRDLFINTTFLEFLRGNNKRRLVVVSPNATENRKNLIGEEKELEKQITCLNMLFGEKDTFQAIKDALMTPKTTEEKA